MTGVRVAAALDAERDLKKSHNPATFAETIAQKADREKADLIVVGTDRLGVFATWALGRVSARLLQVARRAVTVVRVGPVGAPVATTWSGLARAYTWRVLRFSGTWAKTPRTVGASAGVVLCAMGLAASARAQEAALSFEVAVVHVEPTTQIVFKQSAAARFTPSLTPGGFQIKWASPRIIVPFAEKKYDDPFVVAVRFSGDTATIEFREHGLAARAYPLSNPDRVVVEIGRPAAAPAQQPAAPAPAALPPLTIVIDAGHGGTETGAVGPAGLQEKDATLAIARRLSAALTRILSARVLLTRDSDSVIALDDRTALANHEKADLFLSIHANSSRSAGAHGSETYYLSLEASDKLAQEVANQENQAPPPATPAPGAGSARDASLDFILWDLAQSAHLKESSELAEAIQEELNALSGTQNRGIKQAPFRVLVGATMPAVLIETAFISNAEEEKKLGNPTFQQNVADGIAKAVGRFFARRKPGVLRPEPTPAAAPAAAPGAAP